MYKNKGINYEDMYYLINALYEDENGEYVNPILSKYCDEFRREYSGIFKTKYPLIGDLRLIELTHEALSYIQDIVILELSKTPHSIDHLTF